MVVSKQCKYCKKYFKAKYNISKRKFCCMDCAIKFRLEAGWNKPEEQANTLGKGSRKTGTHKITWRNVDSM
jgi:hypothetical protein